MKRKKTKKLLKPQEPSAKHHLSPQRNVRKKVRQYIRSILALSEDMDESFGQFLK